MIGALFGFRHHARLDGSAFQVDGGALRAQMETDGVQTEEFLEHRGKQMLSGVLLHVIETSRPIDFARHLPVRRERRRQKVRDSIVLVHHIDHWHPGDRPDIERLSA